MGTLPANMPLSRKKIESYLSRGMVQLGRVVEYVISGAEKAGGAFKTATKGGAAQPVLSLEGQLETAKLKEIISEASTRLAVIPPLIDKTAIEISELLPKFGERLKEKGASIVAHASLGASGAHAGSVPKGIYSIKCRPTSIPFENGFFDFIMALFATQYQGDIIKDIKEIARLLAIGGDAILVDFHPFGLYAKRGAVRLRPAESTIHGMEDYYKIARLSGLKVIDLREVFIDEALRGMFVSEEEKAAYRIVKDTPLLVGLMVRKGG